MFCSRTLLHQSSRNWTGQCQRGIHRLPDAPTNGSAEILLESLPFSEVSPQLYSNTATTGPGLCANGLPGFLAPLRLAINQVNNYTIPNTGIRVTVLSQNQEEGTFDVRFESHVQDTASTTTSTASSSTSSATSTSTAKSEATRFPGAGKALTFVVVPETVQIANSLW